MDKQETKQLLALLKELFQTWRPKNEQNFILAWSLVLEPYNYDDVKSSAISYARANKYFPDVADLTAGLTKVRSFGRDDNELLKKLLDKGGGDENRKIYH